MPRRFGKYPCNTEDEVLTKEDSFESGRKTGLSWVFPYRPGGPWMCFQGSETDPDWVSYCLATQENHDAWLRGFDVSRSELT